MNATFGLDGTVYSLQVGNFCFDDHYTPGHVALAIIEKGGHANGPDGPIVPTKQLYGFYLPPSVARAIASAMLSAATEAKQ